MKELLAGYSALKTPALYHQRFRSYQQFNKNKMAEQNGGYVFLADNSASKGYRKSGKSLAWCAFISPRTPIETRRLEMWLYLEPKRLSQLEELLTGHSMVKTAALCDQRVRRYEKFNKTKMAETKWRPTIYY